MLNEIYKAQKRNIAYYLLHVEAKTVGFIEKREQDSWLPGGEKGRQEWNDGQKYLRQQMIFSVL